MIYRTCASAFVCVFSVAYCSNGKQMGRRRVRLILIKRETKKQLCKGVEKHINEAKTCYLVVHLSTFLKPKQCAATILLNFKWVRGPVC